jgi:hypothetical protein
MSHDPAGSPRPFDFGDETPADPAQAQRNPFLDEGIVRQDRRRIAWVALIIAVVMSLLLGVAGYFRAAAYADGFDVDRGVRWVALTVLCVVGALAALVITIVAVVRTRAARVPGPLIIAVIALLCALVLPWLALWLGTGLAPQPPTTP